MFATATFYKEEMQALKDKGIPVHAFYVADPARASFKEIADATGGECQALDINSSKGAEDLTNLITGRIMNAIGGESLLQAYNDKYLKGYTSRG